MGFSEPAAGGLCFHGDHGQGDRWLRCLSAEVGCRQPTLVGGSAGAGGGWHHLRGQDWPLEDTCPRSSSPWPTRVTRLPSTTASCSEGDSTTSGRRGVHSLGQGLAGRARFMARDGSLPFPEDLPYPADPAKALVPSKQGRQRSHCLCSLA